MSIEEEELEELNEGDTTQLGGLSHEADGWSSQEGAISKNPLCTYLVLYCYSNQDEIIKS